ncbi:putative endonuclease/exonuclease/phosphatase [Septoria linicola]|nr:putative endonuclease/exonuclease/phosphatase [Septoria linicola]
MQLPVGLSTLLIRIMSYNIRFAATDRGEGEEPWEGVRAPRVISQIRFNTISNPAAFVGMQEVLKSQLDDVMTGLNDGRAKSEPEWAFLGVGRDDGKEAGEYSPLLYRPSVWKLENSSTIWLSPTPEIPGSKGWDAAVTRVLTIGDFENRQTGALVTAMNTHFDHIGAIAREDSARMITEEINKRQNGPGKSRERQQPAIFLTGDFNSEPGQEAYQYLTREDSLVYDVKGAVPATRHYGNRIGTFSGFDGQSDSLIDYIFLNKAGSWTPKTYAVLANVFDEKVYYSDHQAVVTDVELELKRGR